MCLHISIQKVLEQYGVLGSLERLHDGYLRGKCPLHNGDDPYCFLVDIAENSWVCHGSCKERGDALRFVEMREGVKARTARRLIACW